MTFQQRRLLNTKVELTAWAGLTAHMSSTSNEDDIVLWSSPSKLIEDNILSAPGRMN